jgi:hypothetical protein
MNRLRRCQLHQAEQYRHCQQAHRFQIKIHCFVPF